MNLYLIYQSYNRDYDTYDSAVVTAESAEIARRMQPSSGEVDGRMTLHEWTDPEYVKVVYLGKADIINERKVICASFNAG